MPEFVTASDGVALAFERLSPPEEPTSPSIVLVHGFGSGRAQNWKSTGWYGGLTAAGFPIVAMDCRGHGDSGWVGAGGYYHFPDYVFDLDCVTRAFGAPSCRGSATTRSRASAIIDRARSVASSGPSITTMTSIS